MTGWLEGRAGHRAGMEEPAIASVTDRMRGRWRSSASAGEGEEERVKLTRLQTDSEFRGRGRRLGRAGSPRRCMAAETRAAAVRLRWTRRGLDECADCRIGTGSWHCAEIRERIWRGRGGGAATGFGEAGAQLSKQIDSAAAETSLAAPTAFRASSLPASSPPASVPPRPPALVRGLPPSAVRRPPIAARSTNRTRPGAGVRALGARAHLPRHAVADEIGWWSACSHR